MCVCVCVCVCVCMCVYVCEGVCDLFHRNLSYGEIGRDWMLWIISGIVWVINQAERQTNRQTDRHTESHTRRPVSGIFMCYSMLKVSKQQHPGIVRHSPPISSLTAMPHNPPGKRRHCWQIRSCIERWHLMKIYGEMLPPNIIISSPSTPLESRYKDLNQSTTNFSERWFLIYRQHKWDARQLCVRLN